MGKIYQGESLNLVFRCKHKCGVPVDMAGADISVILCDGGGEVAYRFSTLNVAGAKPVTVDGSYIVCRLTNVDTATLAGAYVIEVKVRRSDLVMIEMTKKIKIYSSVIGEDVTL